MSLRVEHQGELTSAITKYDCVVGTSKALSCWPWDEYFKDDYSNGEPAWGEDASMCTAWNKYGCRPRPSKEEVIKDWSETQFCSPCLKHNHSKQPLASTLHEVGERGMKRKGRRCKQVAGMKEKEVLMSLFCSIFLFLWGNFILSPEKTKRRWTLSDVLVILFDSFLSRSMWHNYGTLWSPITF